MARGRADWGSRRRGRGAVQRGGWPCRHQPSHHSGRYAAGRAGRAFASCAPSGGRWAALTARHCTLRVPEQLQTQAQGCHLVRPPLSSRLPPRLTATTPAQKQTLLRSQRLLPSSLRCPPQPFPASRSSPLRRKQWTEFPGALRSDEETEISRTFHDMCGTGACIACACGTCRERNATTADKRSFLGFFPSRTVAIFRRCYSAQRFLRFLHS